MGIKTLGCGIKLTFEPTLERDIACTKEGLTNTGGKVLTVTKYKRLLVCQTPHLTSLTSDQQVVILDD